MPTIILKVAKDADRYVGWSSVVDAPVWIATRAEAVTLEQVTEERLARADLSGTSALYGKPADGAWDASGFVYQQEGWLPRSRLGDFVAAYDADPANPDVSGLLEPFEDDEEIP